MSDKPQTLEEMKETLKDQIMIDIMQNKDFGTVHVAQNAVDKWFEKDFTAWVNENAVCIRNKDRHECEDTPEYCEFALPLSKIVGVEG